MLLYFTAIGLGAFLGISINLWLNKNAIYRIVGTVIILSAGIFACFVILNPLYFSSYAHLVFMLVLTSVLFVGIFIVARIVINHKYRTADDHDVGVKEFVKQKPQQDILKASPLSYPLNKESFKIADIQKIQKINRDTFVKRENMTQALDVVRRDHFAFNQKNDGKHVSPQETVIDRRTPSITEIPSIIPLGPAEAIGENKIINNNSGMSVTRQGNGNLQSDNKESDGAHHKPEESKDTSKQKTKITVTQSTENTDKYIRILSKVHELIEQKRYLYAIELLQVCLMRTQDKALQKQADIILIECLVFSKQFKEAQRMLFEVLNKKYELEPDDKKRLKEAIIKLKA